MSPARALWCLEELMSLSWFSFLDHLSSIFLEKALDVASNIFLYHDLQFCNAHNT
ncbi:hypothetical protein Syun_001028 [Stephania yunnanensis]|uniref:Uncharacterized protein n=1 Tax=Stephania yunnanensis TaxID=152371 RepID=A0AAP0LE51_9MAGN